MATLWAMLRRLVTGLVLGFIVGGALAAALIAGLKTTTFEGGGGVVLGYLAAALTGVMTGLVAGKPIWASGAKTEAGLKAFFGALLGAGAMFGLRQWAGGWALDLNAIGAGGPASVAALPAASLPIIAAVLGGFFELDNTGADGEGKKPGKRVAAATGRESKARVPVEEEGEDGEEDGLPSRRAKR
ncbi:MAG: hypothetical protein ACLP1X_25980 [Polyangiaceae bacterium]